MKLPNNPPAIRNGQMWKKKDTGQIVIITGKQKDDYYRTKKLSGSRSCHGIYKKDLYIFWELI